MSQPASTSALVDGRVSAGHKVTLQALLGTIVASTLMGVVVVLGSAVSDQSHREAGRMIVQSQKQDGYVAMIATSMLASQGRPNRY